MATTIAQPVSEKKVFGDFATFIVAAASGATSMSYNVWWPFMPLYVLKLGAKTDAEALFWVAVATSAQGMARLASGPVWGVLSDHVGRKAMFLRALFLSTLVSAVAALAAAPWQLTISLTLAGLFSGFGPAGVALVSVSVPEAKLNRGLSLLAGAQYLGATTGPALGALLAIMVGYRGAILASSIIPFFCGLAVLFLVPTDRVARAPRGSAAEAAAPKLEPFRMSAQFGLAVFLFFIVFAVNQLVRFATPIALRTIEGREDVTGHAGLVFSLGGLISVISVLLIARLFIKPGNFRLALPVSLALGAAGLLMLALAASFLVYVAGFLIVAAVFSAMSPAANTLIAANVVRSRRGTAFGVAGSAQALAFTVGPATAALFAAISMSLGFAVLAALMLAVGVMMFLLLKEPQLQGESV